MRVFLSWSGETSRQVASALYKWLPYILQPLRPSLSTEISSGDRWGQVLEAELKDAEYGIICLTQYNIAKPWLNFESGVLSRFIDRAWLTPLLFNLDPSSLTGPLSQFQYAQCNEQGVLKLIQSINKRLDQSIDDAIVQAAFGIWWPELQKALNSITPNPLEETRTAYQWLYTFADLAIHEENKDIRAIWVITDNVTKHATEYEVREKLKANLEKGVEYRFFVPNDPDICTALNDLNRACKGRIEIRCFDLKDFYTHAATDYIIVYPQNAPLLAFFRLMVAEGNKDDLWVKVDEGSALKLQGRFDIYWQNGKPIKGEDPLDTAISVCPSGDGGRYHPPSPPTKPHSLPQPILHRRNPLALHFDSYARECVIKRRSDHRAAPSV
jgi:hypothetical protein